MATDNPPEVTVTAIVGIVAVTFVKGWGLYNTGETAGFEADKAKWLIDKKLATLAATPQ